MKSFHISRVRPFFRNIPKEIRRTPKMYFNDLGLRNYFVRNFEPIGLREDKGALFENFIFWRFLYFKEKYPDIPLSLIHFSNDLSYPLGKELKFF